MVRLSPPNIHSVFDNFYYQHAATDASVVTPSNLEALEPSQVFAMHKMKTLNSCDLKKLEILGIKDKIRQPLLLKSKFGAAVGISSLLSSQSFGFKADGPDDMANLAKEAVEGIAQPLMHLGVLSLFYPFVSMGARGLSQDNQDIKEALQETKINIQQELSQLNMLVKTLKEKGVIIPLFEISQGLQKQTFMDKISTHIALLSKALQSQMNQSQDGESLGTEVNQTLVQALRSTLALGFMHERAYLLRQERSEVWLAAKGMRGMQRAMQLFLLEAASSLMTFLTAGKVSSFFSSATTAVGVAGTSIMGAAQFLMMTSGILKVKAGLMNFCDMRKSTQQQKTNLNKVKIVNLESVELQQALARKVKHDRSFGKWTMLQNVIPGSSLAVGQGLMLAWSVMSLALVISGVGAPFGIGVMLSLLIPGVGLTLVAAMPKIGLEAVLEKMGEHRFGANSEDDGFDELAYIKGLPIDRDKMAKHAESLGGLLDQIEAMDSLAFKHCIVSHKAEKELTQQEEFSIVYKLLAKIDQLEDFGVKTLKIKGVKSLFHCEHLLEYKPVHKVLSLRYLKKPLELRNSRLFHKENQRLVMKKLYHFQPKKVDNSLLSAKVLDLAVDMLHDFSKRQLRAELQATQKVLGTLR